MIWPIRDCLSNSIFINTSEDHNKTGKATQEITYREFLYSGKGLAADRTAHVWARLMAYVMDHLNAEGIKLITVFLIKYH